jgi:hypothetical protein
VQEVQTVIKSMQQREHKLDAFVKQHEDWQAVATASKVTPDE